jgi:hypothetical protein
VKVVKSHGVGTLGTVVGTVTPLNGSFCGLQDSQAPDLHGYGFKSAADLWLATPGASLYGNTSSAEA